MSAEAKRTRGLNFSPREVNHLFTVALQYKNILENKQTNGVTNSQKTEAWVKIANEFNAISSDLNHRNIDQLKRCYDNKKQAMRKKRAQIRQEALKTGGGLPPPEAKKDELDDLVLATMDPITVEGNFNKFDSDVICPILGVKSPAIDLFVFENSENTILDEGTEIGNEDNPERTIEIRDMTHFKKEHRSLSPVSEKNCMSITEAIMSNTLDNTRDNTAQLSSCSLTNPSKRKALSAIEANIHKSIASTSREEKTTEKTNWKKFNTNDLKRPLNPALLQPGIRDKNELQGMDSEDEQVNVPVVVSQIENQDVKNKKSRANSGGRGGKGTPRRGPDRRRPTATLVKTLASNALAEKYEYLADKKNIIADFTIKKMERDRLHAEEEHRLRIQCLQLDVEIRRKQLEKLSH